MPLSIPVGSAAQATLHEWSQPSGGGVEVPPIGPVTYASDNAAVATVTASGTIMGVSAGTANISGTDAGNSLTASDVLTVATLTAVSATLELTALVKRVK